MTDALLAGILAINLAALIIPYLRSQATEAPKLAAEPAMTMKVEQEAVICPYCQEGISAKARRCPYCTTNLLIGR